MTAQDRRGGRGGRRGPQPARAARRGWRTSHRQRGLAYLALLIGIAIIGIAAAATIQLGALYRRSMAEKELLYVGDQFQRALLSYADNTPLGLPTQPRTLDELVRDPRYPNPIRHLRRVYADPMTGKADWVLVLSPNGQTIVGIHSASREHPIKLRQFAERFRGFEDKRSYTQWVFVARPPQLAPGQRPPNAAMGGMPGLPLRVRRCRSVEIATRCSRVVGIGVMRGARRRADFRRAMGFRVAVGSRITVAFLMAVASRRMADSRPGVLPRMVAATAFRRATGHATEEHIECWRTSSAAPAVRYGFVPMRRSSRAGHNYEFLTQIGLPKAFRRLVMLQMTTPSPCCDASLCVGRRSALQRLVREFTRGKHALEKPFGCSLVAALL